MGKEVVGIQKLGNGPGVPQRLRWLRAEGQAKHRPLGDLCTFRFLSWDSAVSRRRLSASPDLLCNFMRSGTCLRGSPADSAVITREGHILHACSLFRFSTPSCHQHSLPRRPMSLPPPGHYASFVRPTNCLRGASPQAACFRRYRGFVNGEGWGAGPWYRYYLGTPCLPCFLWVGT